ncbi:MAG: CYTH domain-containing protein [Propylenella sp.]
MPREIERKFVVASDEWRRGADRGKRLRQAYIAETDRAVVRVRIEDDARGVLTIKSAESGLSRHEYEFPLKVADDETLIALRQGSVLTKTRFHAPHAGRTWEVDVYFGDNAGLVIAEIELAAEDEAVELPAWLGREVTGAAQYYAARLAHRPYTSWSESERGKSG